MAYIWPLWRNKLTRTSFQEQSKRTNETFLTSPKGRQFRRCPHFYFCAFALCEKPLSSKKQLRGFRSNWRTDPSSTSSMRTAVQLSFSIMYTKVEMYLTAWLEFHTTLSPAGSLCKSLIWGTHITAQVFSAYGAEKMQEGLRRACRLHCFSVLWDTSWTSQKLSVETCPQLQHLWTMYFFIFNL